MSDFISDNNNMSLVVYGEDLTTNEIDGMTENEFMNLKVYRNGEVFNVTATYNTAMPNYNGLFALNGLSQITNLKLGATSIEENPLESISIYPNPSNGIFNIDIYNADNNVNMIVINAQGQIVYSEKVGTSTQIDLSNQPDGIYFVKFINNNNITIKKIIVR